MKFDVTIHPKDFTILPEEMRDISLRQFLKKHVDDLVVDYINQPSLMSCYVSVEFRRKRPLHLVKTIENKSLGQSENEG